MNVFAAYHTYVAPSYYQNIAEVSQMKSHGVIVIIFPHISVFFLANKIHVINLSWLNNYT